MIIHVKQNLEDPVSYEMRTITEDMTCFEDYFDAIHESVSDSPLDWWSKIDWKAEFLNCYVSTDPERFDSKTRRAALYPLDVSFVPDDTAMWGLRLRRKSHVHLCQIQPRKR